MGMTPTSAMVAKAMELGALGTDRTAYMAFLYSPRAGWCLAKGPRTARCCLPPQHASDHEGNGADEWGPRYERWANNALPLTWKSPRRKQNEQMASNLLE